MPRILGLDLGSHSVKAVVYDTTQRSLPVQLYMEIPRAQDGTPQESLRAALIRLHQEPLGPIDQVMMSLPGPSLVTHSFSLPFKDAKRIEAALPFEVEGQLPVELNEVLFDYQITEAKGEKVELVVGVVRRGEMTSLLEILKELSLEPRVVTHPAMAYQSLWLAKPEQFVGQPGNWAVVDIGHERTTIAIGGDDGALYAARAFAGGGRDLTRALALDLQITVPEAHHLKEQRGAVGNEASGADAERVSGALLRGIQPVIRELRATLKGYTARTQRQVTRIYLCGGTARLPGLVEQLAKELNISTRLLQQEAELATVLPSSESPEAIQAYALALRGQLPLARAPRFNLRRGDLAFKGHYDFLKVRIARLAAYAAALLFLFIVFGMVRNSMLGQREAAVDQQLCTVTKQVLGKCVMDFKLALNQLRGQESPAAAVPKITAVNLLAELSSKIPADSNVTLDQIIVDLDRITLRGTTDSSKQVDRVTQALKGYRCFKTIQLGKLDKTKDDHVQFRLEIEVDCSDKQASAG